MKAGAPWARAFERSFKVLARSSLRAGARAAGLGLKAQIDKRRPPAGEGDWIAGIAIGAGGARRYRLYRPPAIQSGEQLPLLVMLHGCGQDANSFAQSTRMNLIAARERFMVLYPEQDRLANARGCWNWFDTRAGRAAGEAELIMGAVEQVCLLYAADRARIAVAGLSAGASMAALLVTRHPDRFKAVVMHSGIAPGSAHSGLSALAAMHGHGTATALPSGPGSASVPRSWPPLLVIHGGRDRTVAASNGQAAVRVWAEAAGASPVALRSVQRGKRHPMTVTDFKAGGATVASLVVVPQLGHAWSGGAASQPYGDARGPDASRMAWAFVARQFPA
ncbi:alpha/beta hydrolase family esterase [Caenimonas terrae]|uniref:Alpha/beta hydrolase family esterase n=1 Tax=Caenimonas terrae TaxID=696074 RepID=A0ABW0NJ42_9BURK